MLAALPAEATLLDAVAKAVAAAAAHNPNDAVAPAVILWTDSERQWEPLVPTLRERLPLLTFGPYDPETRTGPAYWLRCAIAGVLEEVVFPAGATPVIYLPGVSRADLRAVESCPRELQPLAELQYRGVFWSHKNGRDWTIAGFLQSPEGGLGIPALGDAETADALRAGVKTLAREPLVTLRANQPLRAAFVHELLTPDPGRTLLHWLSDPDKERANLSPEEWQAFLGLCKDVYDFRPEQDGPLTGVRKLGRRQGAWGRVWETFVQSPERFPGVIARLDQESPTQLTMFETEDPYDGGDDPRSPWPAHNRRAEAELRDALRLLEQTPPAEARETVLGLEARHGARRDWVWAKLKHSTLARALEPLATLADRTRQSLTAEDTTAFVEAYAAESWRTDHAFLAALASVADASPDDSAAVRLAADVIYRPWLSEGSAAFQAAVLDGGAIDYPDAPLLAVGEGVCLLFVDALRFDLGMELAERVQDLGFEAAVTPRLAALPTVTSTAKPAVSPVAGLLSAGDGFETVSPTGSKVTEPVLSRLIEEAGFQVLPGMELGTSEGRAWSVEGRIDPYGHSHGWMVARHGFEETGRLAQRIKQLLDWGWREVVVVTDHGWLLLPEKLPTAELPLHLTETRKGRCARLQEGAQTDEQTVPWHWDPAVRVAMARGIRCYEAGKVYEHGGLSPQECITPVVSVKRPASVAPVAIEGLRWSGLRCRVSLSGATKAMTVDLRTSPADPSSSIADTPKIPDPDGTTTVFLAGDRDDLAGQEAYIVVVAKDGAILAQQQTMIGG